MKRAAYSAAIAQFLDTSREEVIGHLVQGAGFAVELGQRDAWQEQIDLLHTVLGPYRDRGALHLEYSIPRLGKRADGIVILGPVIFVLEFKVGAAQFLRPDLEQVWDYALDLKNFHEPSHHCLIAPVLIATAARNTAPAIGGTPDADGLLQPIRATPGTLAQVISAVLSSADAPVINPADWEGGRYCPTPTIIEAAMALYGGHQVEEISRKEAGAENLAVTSRTIDEVIGWSKAKSCKSICFVTGVPGAGKTLVGLDVATRHCDKKSELHSVFLSGNGPLVAVLREALARDQVRRARERGQRTKLGAARREVQAFIQNVHHFRDDCLADRNPPIEHVAIFDEAQRAWNREQTAKYMKKKGHGDFAMSEPQFLVSCLDRHPDWAVVICLVGGGQEINTGESGIGPWLEALRHSFPHWHVHISSRLTDSEYAAQEHLDELHARPNITVRDELHLGVSMRSFRAENVSLLVKQLLDLDAAGARQTLATVREHYPLVITRDLAKAKRWLKSKARGSERFGVVVSSHAYRLKPHAIDVRLQVDPVQWFLGDKDDVRSSYYLEDAATEYRVQGLELDWACVTWDADLRHCQGAWQHWAFVGDHWNRVRRPERQTYLKNAYRVLLTRARQGMVIVVPPGDTEDPTRRHEFYDPTFAYLQEIGFETM